MRYQLRCNHHRRDMGDLLLQGLRPAVERVRAMFAEAKVAAQPHWTGGPHILVATDGCDAAAASELIAEDLRSWLARQDLGLAIDPGWRVKLRDSLPGGDADLSGVHRDGTVDVGDFTPPRPRGDEVLGSSRDLLRAETLDQAFEMIGLRQSDQGEGVVQFALRLMALRRLRWLDGLNLWGMSITGHEFANRGVFNPPASAHIADQLEARLLSRLDETGLMTSRSIAAPLQGWVDALQRSYDRYNQYASDEPGRFADWGLADASGPAPIDGAQAWWDRAARDPRRVIYRLIVNDAYDLQSIIGLPVIARPLACHIICRVLVKHFPAEHAELQETARSYAA